MLQIKKEKRQKECIVECALKQPLMKIWKEETYFMRVTNLLKGRVRDYISNWKYICWWTSDYCRQSGSKKRLEKCVNASYKEHSLYYPCRITLVAWAAKSLTSKYQQYMCVKTQPTIVLHKKRNSAYMTSSHSLNNYWRNHHTSSQHQYIILKC